jgi:hypothetical protein
LNILYYQVLINLRGIPTCPSHGFQGLLIAEGTQNSFLKIDGFEVMPEIMPALTYRSIVPSSSKSRWILSYHMD